MKKRGEITTKQIVSMVVLIASFAVLLFLFARLDFGEINQEQICHNSVVTGGQGLVRVANTISGTFEVPLDCKTQYNNINQETKTKEDALELIANEMASCWWMFGEGKVNYVGLDLFGDHCAICNELDFSSIPYSLTFQEINDYLRDTDYKGQSYQNYLQTNVQTSGNIDPSKVYVIYTGRNVEAGQDVIINVNLVERSQISNYCDEFVTRA